LETAECTIGPNDLIIAAHARALGLTLVTDNLTAFSRVPGLLVQNWLSSTHL
jgi:tRNA(fMet)-specific endonuclease VapC